MDGVLVHILQTVAYIQYLCVCLTLCIYHLCISAVSACVPLSVVFIWSPVMDGRLHAHSKTEQTPADQMNDNRVQQ